MSGAALTDRGGGVVSGGLGAGGKTFYRSVPTRHGDRVFHKSSEVLSAARSSDTATENKRKDRVTGRRKYYIIIIIILNTEKKTDRVINVCACKSYARVMREAHLCDL